MEWLFVYGTLRPGHAPAEVAEVVKGFGAVGRGAVRGRLFDLGEYPGLVLDDSAGSISGEVFAVPESAWVKLDAYEGYRAEQPVASLFLRLRTAVVLDNGDKTECWIYVYNGKIFAPAG